MKLKKFVGSRGLLGVAVNYPSAWWIVDRPGQKYLVLKTSQGWIVQSWNPSNVPNTMWSSTCALELHSQASQREIKRLEKQSFSTRREALQALDALLLSN